MSFQSNRPSDNPLPLQGRRRPLFIILLVLVLLFVITYASRLNEYRRLLGQEISMSDQIADAEARERQLAHDLDYVKSQEYTEKVAIEEMGLGRDHDQVLTIVDAQTPAKATQAQDAATDNAGGERLLSPKRSRRPTVNHRYGGSGCRSSNRGVNKSLISGGRIDYRKTDAETTWHVESAGFDRHRPVWYSLSIVAGWSRGSSSGS